MTTYDFLIYFIIFIKILFFGCATGVVVLTLRNKQIKDPKDPKYQKNAANITHLNFWKEHFEFIFIALMAILLIYKFTPAKKDPVVIDFETKVLLTAFGWILLLTANWGLFFKESPLFKRFQSALGKGQQPKSN